MGNNTTPRTFPSCDWCGAPAVCSSYRTLYVDTEFENTSRFFECASCAGKSTAELTECAEE